MEYTLNNFIIFASDKNIAPISCAKTRFPQKQDYLFKVNRA